MDKWNEFIQSLSKIDWTDFGIALIIFIVFLLFRKLFTKYIFKVILALSKQTPTPLFTNILLAFERPLHILWVVLGMYLALLYLPFKITEIQVIEHLFRTFFILLIGWGIYNYVSKRSLLFARLARKFDVDEDSMFIPFISNVARFIVLALIIVVIVAEWGYNISGFVAGLGLGGLAFALAAQETIANFFGGVVIITEKPFAKGHWIETPTIEGVVEDIGFRSTEIRTFADALVTIPNSTLSNEPITNWSVMTKRRVTMDISAIYGTPREKLENCLNQIDAYLRAHEGIDQEFILVKFKDFTEKGLCLHLYFFTKTTSWEEWYEIKQEVSFVMMDIFEKEGISLAVPVRSVKLTEEAANKRLELAEKIKNSEED